MIKLFCIIISFEIMIIRFSGTLRQKLMIIFLVL